jgi:hypothetical protein
MRVLCMHDREPAQQDACHSDTTQSLIFSTIFDHFFDHTLKRLFRLSVL